MVADLKGDLNLNFGHAATLGIGFAFLLAHMCGFYCIAVCFQHRQHEEARQVRGDEQKEAAEQRAADEKENDKLREEARRVRVQEMEDATEQRAADERENDKLREEARRVRKQETEDAAMRRAADERENDKLRDERRLIRVQEKEEAAMRRAADEKHNDKLVAALQKMNDALIAANKTASDALSDALVSAIHQAGEYAGDVRCLLISQICRGVGSDPCRESSHRFLKVAGGPANSENCQ